MQTIFLLRNCQRVRAMVMTDAGCWSSFFSCPPHNYSLDAIIGSSSPRFDVFTVSTPVFMREQWPGLFLGFFNTLVQTGNHGFLVTKRVVDCEAATRLGIACAVSNDETRRGCLNQRSPSQQCGRRWDSDIMMSQEKWVIIERFLLAGRRILFAGADTRMLRPTRALFATASFHAADAIFDAHPDDRLSALVSFTPDIFAFAATEPARSFVRRVREAIHAFSHPMLVEIIGNVLGPADQVLGR